MRLTPRNNPLPYKIYYTLDKTRDDTVMVLARVPGKHYEIEVFADGKIEVEVYQSVGQIGGQEFVDELLRDYSEPNEPVA